MSAIRIPVTIRSGKNHGRYGEVIEYSFRNGGYLVDFDEGTGAIHDGVIIKRQPKKRYYAFDRLLTMSPKDGLRLYNMAPASRRKEKHIAQLVANRLKDIKRQETFDIYGRLMMTGRITNSQPNIQQYRVMKLEGK